MSICLCVCALSCRASDSGDIREASQVFAVRGVAGLQLFGGGGVASGAHSCLLVVINHIEKTVISVKMEYESYW